MLTETIRKMASVQKIASLAPIENSDFLEVAMMENLGWKVVVKKGEFKPGDAVIYFEIDSAINVKDLPECLAFLKDKGTKKLFTGRTPETSAFSEEYVRIKTIKLRGQVSQGLVIPFVQALAPFPKEVVTNEDGTKVMNFHNPLLEIEEDGKDGPILVRAGGKFVKPEVGLDLTQEFHVEVWDRLLEWFEERSQLGPRAGMHAAGSFPSDVPKTDEVRLESLMEYFTDPEMVDAEWECTEKNDGSSCTLFFRPTIWNRETGKPTMQISSRRFLLKDDGCSDDWFEPFKRMGWETLEGLMTDMYVNGIGDKENPGEYLLPPLHEVAIQGEMIGPKFNGNRDRNKEAHFRVFRIFDITDQKFVTPKVRYAICKHLGLEHVKVIDTCKIFHRLHNIDDFEAYVDRKSDNGNQIEGVVFKRVDDGFISFKKVSGKYLLKNGD